jgi:hypothetical protein
MPDFLVRTDQRYQKVGVEMRNADLFITPHSTDILLSMS